MSLALEPSFDDLFARLRDALSAVREEESDDFKKIQKRLAKLPKINSRLEETGDAPPAKQDITRINDPIVVKAKKTQEDTAGANWFGMAKPEFTPQIKRDLAIIQQRSALDPKRHYKKDKWQIPKHFSTGTIIEGNTDYYSRMLKRSRGRTLTEEILNDGDSSKYFKRKYAEIQQQKTSGRKAHYKAVKERRKRY